MFSVIEQIGTPKQVFREPASRFVAKFVGSNNILIERIDIIVNDKLTIETNLGKVEAVNPVHRDVSLGDQIELVISANQLTLSPNQDTSNNQFACNIVSEKFTGTVTSLVKTDNAVEVRIQKQQRELEQVNIPVKHRYRHPGHQKTFTFFPKFNLATEGATYHGR